MRTGNPVPLDIFEWRGEGMTLAGCRKAIFRRRGVTVIFSQTTDGWWHITKLKGGRELASRVVKELPARQASLVQDAIRTTRQQAVKV